MQKRVRIGCAGWSIPSRHAPLFGDGDSHLARWTYWRRHGSPRML